MASPKRKLAEKTGKRAEAIARLWLRLKGSRILNYRFKTKVGEIDIIAKKGRTIAIIEVKARQTKIAALQSITFKQRQRIERTTELWLKRTGFGNTRSLRFDIIAIVPKHFPIHIKQAWQSGE